MPDSRKSWWGLRLHGSLRRKLAQPDPNQARGDGPAHDAHGRDRVVFAIAQLACCVSANAGNDRA